MSTTLCLLFQSGAVQKFKVSDWEATQVGQRLAALTWTTRGTTKLVWADITEIACVWVEH